MGFFLLGLQWTHLDVGPLQHFTLTWASIQNWGLFLKGVAVLLVGLIGSLLYLDFEGLKRSHVVHRYLIWLVILVGFMVFNTKRLSPGRALHVHHYVVAFMLLSVIGYQNEILTIAHGFCMGMFIEGGCRYGFDPIWTKTCSSNEVDDNQITKPKKVAQHSTQERQRWIAIKSH